MCTWILLILRQNSNIIFCCVSACLSCLSCNNKYHRLVDLQTNKKKLYLKVLEEDSPQSKHGQIQCLGRVYIIHRLYNFYCLSMVEGAIVGSVYSLNRPGKFLPDLEYISFFPPISSPTGTQKNVYVVMIYVSSIIIVFHFFPYASCIV